MTVPPEGLRYAEVLASKRVRMFHPASSNQSMKPTAPDEMNVSDLATDPARGLSLSR